MGSRDTRTLPRSIGLGLAVLAAGASLATAAPLVDARSLTVNVERDPWRLSFADATGVVLGEASASAPVAGPLGFRLSSGWIHATRLASLRRGRRKATLVAETDDVLGRRLKVDIRADADGVIALAMRILGGARDDVLA